MRPRPIARDLVVAHTRALKLLGVARVFEGLARQASDAHWPHEDRLQEVLSTKQASRHESVIRQRLREARFPEVRTFVTVDFAAPEGVNAAMSPGVPFAITATLITMAVIIIMAMSPRGKVSVPVKPASRQTWCCGRPLRHSPCFAGWSRLVRLQPATCCRCGWTSDHIRLAEESRPI